MSVDVAVVGSPFLDLTFEGLPRVPSPGEEVTARALHATPGGTGVQAVALARLGVSVALVAPLGDGFGSDHLRRLFGEEGVRLVGHASGDPTTVTALLSTPEGVAMASFVGSDEPTADDVVGSEPTAVLASLGRLHLAPSERTVYAMTGGLEIPGIDPSVLDDLAHVRTFIANRKEAAALSGAVDPESAARALAGRGTTAVVTMGPNGALGVSGDDVIRVPAPSVETVDATGAGDLFVAAYVWADLRSAPLPDRLRWATLYAALSLTAPTAFAGALRLDRLLAEGAARGLSPP